MKQYLLSVHDDSAAPAPSEEQIAQMYADVDGFNKEILASGAWVFGGGLFPPDTATVVTAKGGDVLVTDGPYLEAKEYLGGFWVVQAADLDAAVALAGRASAACQSPVEVRPFQDVPDE